MPTPRSQLVCIEDTPYYHCTSRCVRRAFLCGNDDGRSYEHRRQFIEDRLRILASTFAIDVCAYAIMSNHYHIVVKLQSTRDWPDDKVLRHWLTLHRGPLLAQRYRDGETLSPVEQQSLSEVIQLWRTRLQDLSWFMKCLNEPIARAANREDRCTGHFWEARYSSQALLTEQALLTCMAYVDLNPIRANMATTPETSEHTSVRERIVQQFNLAEAIKGQPLPNPFEIPLKPLLAFEDSVSHYEQSGILYSLSDYLQLVDWTGRAIRDDKRGHIAHQLPPILARLGIPIKDWLNDSQHFESVFRRRFKTAA